MPGSNIPTQCPVDKPIGTTIMVLAVVGGAVLTSLVSLILSVISGIFPSFNQTNTTGNAPFELFLKGNQQTPFLHPIEPTLASQSNQAPLWLFAAVAVLFALFLVTGYGIRLGRQWAFSLGIVLFSFVTLGGNGAAVLGIAVVVYCVLRKLQIIEGKVLPRPL
jgi:hypothetical protein